MSREDELRAEIEILNGEIGGIRAQIKPLMKKIERRAGRLKGLKKELWELLKDDFQALLGEQDAFAEMKDYCARRFGVPHGDAAPVCAAGYFPQSGEQAFRIMVESGTDLEPVAAFLREIVASAKKVTPDGREPRWQFEVITPDNNSSGIVSLATEDGVRFSLVKMVYSRERALAGPGTLEEMLETVRKDFAMDVEQDDEGADDSPGWGR